MTTIIVPTVDAFMVCTDDELAAWLTRLQAAVADCEANAAGARDAGNEEGCRRIQAAARHYVRGIRTVRAIQAQRAGVPQFKPAAAVVDFPTAVANSKATMRLMGLLHDLFHAVGVWLDADDDADEAEFAELERAYDACTEALNAGQVAA